MKKKPWWKDLVLALLSALIGIIGKDTYDQSVTTPQIVATVTQQVTENVQPVLDSLVNERVENELVHQYLKTTKK